MIWGLQVSSLLHPKPQSQNPEPKFSAKTLNPKTLKPKSPKTLNPKHLAKRDQCLDQARQVLTARQGLRVALALHGRASAQRV